MDVYFMRLLVTIAMTLSVKLDKDKVFQKPHSKTT